MSHMVIFYPLIVDHLRCRHTMSLRCFQLNNAVQLLSPSVRKDGQLSVTMQNSCYFRASCHIKVHMSVSLAYIFGNSPWFSGAFLHNLEISSALLNVASQLSTVSMLTGDRCSGKDSNGTGGGGGDSGGEGGRGGRFGGGGDDGETDGESQRRAPWWLFAKQRLRFGKEQHMITDLFVKHLSVLIATFLLFPWISEAAPLVIPVEKLQTDKYYKCTEIEVKTQEDSDLGLMPIIEQMLSFRVGEEVDQESLFHDQASLRSSSWFCNVQILCETIDQVNVKVIIEVEEVVFGGASSCKCVSVGLVQQSSGQCLLPHSMEKKLSQILLVAKKVSFYTMNTVKKEIEEWYHSHGFDLASVQGFDGLGGPEITVNVSEGVITEVNVAFEDKTGSKFIDGILKPEVILRELPATLSAGFPYNKYAAAEALSRLSALEHLSSVRVEPRWRDGEVRDGGTTVDVVVCERPLKNMDVDLEWTLGQGGPDQLGLVNLMPGGSVSVEHRNLDGWGQSAFGSLSTSSFLHPEDDLGFRLEWKIPVRSAHGFNKRYVNKVQVMNTRGLCPALTQLLEGEGGNPVWIDRVGVRAMIQENFSQQSHVTLGAVVEEITIRDETGESIGKASKTLPSGIELAGPTTSMGGSGHDIAMFLQANITRDTTRFVNGTPIGTRNIFQVEQGLGLGTGCPLFNRFKYTSTHFLQLAAVKQKVPLRLPPVLVLHARCGGCIGDLPVYDAHTLGGPYSVRGYSIGALGVARHFLEMSSEIRLPVAATHVYGFVEYGTDFGTSKYVQGNPTHFFQKPGNGVSVGIGWKTTPELRVEFAQDCNSREGAISVRYGERY